MQHFLGWVALLQLGAVVAAVVTAFHSYDPDAATGIGRLILWPGAVHPVWLSIVAAVAAFLTCAVLAGRAGGRAERNATCPMCGLRLADPVPAPSA
ncbi:hypothetical protein ABZT17_34935 [Streptomyces sp. NPDC005648]|uniref:hypothetical protein n=1 Tax=Streptomyces sp. NPDC005648 TaxID=3157044 RepID=UPI0033A80CF2